MSDCSIFLQLSLLLAVAGVFLIADSDMDADMQLLDFAFIIAAVVIVLNLISILLFKVIAAPMLRCCLKL